MFGVPKHIALSYVLQRTNQFLQTSILDWSNTKFWKYEKKRENSQHFGLKIPKMTFLIWLRPSQ